MIHTWSTLQPEPVAEEVHSQSAWLAATLLSLRRRRRRRHSRQRRRCRLRRRSRPSRP